GRHDEAISHYQEAIRLDPKVAVRAHTNLGKGLYNKGQLEEAIGHYQEAIRLDPKDRPRPAAISALLCTPRAGRTRQSATSRNPSGSTAIRPNLFASSTFPSTPPPVRPPGPRPAGALRKLVLASRSEPACAGKRWTCSGPTWN